jgi:predicted MFS family arabinose efflux permease
VSPAAAPGSAASERLIIFLVGAVQFVNILDFMMVMPLGPDFAKALGISTAHLGTVGGSYAASAAVAGVLAAPLLDRFDRRKALGVAIFGLVIGTAAGALARGLYSLVVARAIAGAFGGPATSLALSIIADVIPPARRGRAMGAVMGAFSAASVLGVPLGLRLARLGGWQLPFIAVAGTGVVIGVLAVRAMPSMRGHIAVAAATPRLERMRALLGDSTVRLSLVMNALVMMTAFLVIPNIAAYLQQNFHYPRADIELLYFVGGATSFFVMRIAGRGIDRLGSAPVAAVGTAILLVVLYVGFIAPGSLDGAAIMALFVSFMIAMSVRNVSMSSLSTRVPRGDQRAGYMSLQSTAQHIASATGAFLGSQLLREGPDGRLVGIRTVATLSAALALTLPPLLAVIGRRVRVREAAAAATSH